MAIEMVEIPNICEFEVGADQLQFTTQTNGDKIRFRGIHLSELEAAALAIMINKPDNRLRIEIKEAT